MVRLPALREVSGAPVRGQPSARLGLDSAVALAREDTLLTAIGS